jgi:flagellum-specific ATP synthase
MEALLPRIESVPLVRVFGRVARVEGLKIEIEGAGAALAIGTEAQIEIAPGRTISAEIIGLNEGRALALPLGELEGVRLGCRAFVGAATQTLSPSRQWLGRVIDGLGRPIDGRGPLPDGPERRLVKAPPMPAHLRARVGGRIDLGVRALNNFVTVCEGQRMGVFAGSGVGKSVLLSMMARYTEADVAIVGLIGERGREVQEFIEDDLGAEGLERSVVVVATSNEPALIRRRAAYVTLMLAEYFRDRGARVLCLMDSVTRFAMAQREIGLSCGEPPTTKGYTPTVFAELARLLERAGPGAKGEPGSITGLFTVLVDGDDLNEPISDAVRGILDGHIVMDRAIAERGRYPAIHVLKSVSRTMPGCNSEEEQEIIRAARRSLSTFDDMAELIRLGAYTQGADTQVDQAIAYQPHLEAFLNQRKNEKCDIESGFSLLEAILSDHRLGGKR